jgi:predicted Zn finger-like uncharacterized protein
MPLTVACDSCATKLKIPDSLAGRKAKCPRCGNVIVAAATAAPIAEPAPSARPGKSKKPAEPQEPDYPMPEQEEQQEPDRSAGPKKRRKRKKKRREQQQAGGIPGWVWWAGGLACIVITAIIAMGVAIRAGHGAEVLALGIRFGVMVPISLVILIASMIISSHLGGGINFGEVHTVILKGSVLLILVNLIYLVPFGGLLAFPIWLIGVMVTTAGIKDLQKALPRLEIVR